MSLVVGRRPCRRRCVPKINDFFDRWLELDASGAAAFMAAEE